MKVPKKVIKRFAKRKKLKFKARIIDIAKKATKKNSKAKPSKKLIKKKRKRKRS